MSLNITDEFSSFIFRLCLNQPHKWFSSVTNDGVNTSELALISCEKFESTAFFPVNSVTHMFVSEIIIIFNNKMISCYSSLLHIQFEMAFSLLQDNFVACKFQWKCLLWIAFNFNFQFQRIKKKKRKEIVQFHLNGKKIWMHSNSMHNVYMHSWGLICDKCSINDEKNVSMTTKLPAIADRFSEVRWWNR